MLTLAHAVAKIRNLWGGWHTNAVPNRLYSRFRGNDGGEIRNNSAIIASLRPLRLRVFASNFLCQHVLVPAVYPGETVSYPLLHARHANLTLDSQTLTTGLYAIRSSATHLLDPETAREIAKPLHESARIAL